MTPVSVRAAAALCALLLVGCGPQLVSFRHHPEMIEKLKAIGRVAMLPPDVTVVEMDLYGDYARLVDIEEQVKGKLESSIADRFKTRGFELQPARLQETDLGDDARIRYDLTRLEVDYSHLSSRVYRKELNASQAAAVQASMTPLVNRFADRAQADLLLFTSFAGFVKSEGMRQKDGFFTVIAALLGTYRQVPVAGALLEMALVNGTNGELLWINRAGAVFFQEIDASFLVDSSLEQFRELYHPPEEEVVTVDEPVIGDQ